jgi:hypothetical protein
MNSWEDNIKMDLKLIVYECFYWIELARCGEERGEGSCEHANELLGTVQVGEFLM